MCYSYPIGLAIEVDRYQRRAQELAQQRAYEAMRSKPEAPKEGCTQCGTKSFRLTSDHGNWKHICSYCGSDK